MSYLEGSSKPPSSQSLPSRSALDDIPRETKIIDGSLGAASRELSQPLAIPQIDAAAASSTNAPMAPLRVGTLSWQRQPSSRASAGSSSGRPLSATALKSNDSDSSLATVDQNLGYDEGISRSQIAQSLRSKDPAWFKQTQDRGLGSAAFRRNRDDSLITASTIGGKRLPGMSRESTIESDGRAHSALESGRPPSPEGSARGVSGSGLEDSSPASLASAGGIGSPLPTMKSQRFEPPSTPSRSGGDNSSIARTLAMSPSQGRLSPERVDRPASPTKGLGGFVQSAMLKRSDSVSKRWNAQAGPGLSRGGSIASNRTGYDATRYPMGGITPLKDSRPNILNPENSMEMISRPRSSHGDAAPTQGQIENERTTHSASLTSIHSGQIQDQVSKSVDTDSKPPLSPKQDDKESMISPPASPSKKWSPTKASWLEHAIHKPNSPHVMSPAPPQQPPWMVEVNRAKQNRGSVDMPKGGNFKEVATNGLVRSPPLGGYKPLGSNEPNGFRASAVAEAQVKSPESTNVQYESPPTTHDNDDPRQSTPPHTSEKESETKADPTGRSPADGKAASSALAREKSPLLVSRAQSPSTAELKPEMTSKVDLKSTLKSRQSSREAKSQSEPEFKSVFGNLKRTQTQNYKAPDELKDNILRGKAGLAVTGNPKRIERKDEFKESILKKKEGMVAPLASTTIKSAISKRPEDNIPEAVAKRQGLTKPEKSLADGSMGRTIPEALVRLQGLQDKPKPIHSAKQSDAAANMKTKGGEFASSLAGLLQRGPLTMTAGGKPRTEHSSADDQDLHTQGIANDEEAASVGPELQHVTKARARGPKRRLPTARKQYAAEGKPHSRDEPSSSFPQAGSSPHGSTTTIAESQKSPPNTSKLESRPLSNITHYNNSNRKTPQSPIPRKPSTSVAQSFGSKTSPSISLGRGIEPQNNPAPVMKQKPSVSPKMIKAPTASESVSEPVPDTPLQRSATEEPLDFPELHRSAASATGAAAIWGQLSTLPSQPRSPVKLPARKGGEATQEGASLRPKGPAEGPVGLGIEAPTKEHAQLLGGSSPSSVTPSPKSPPLPGRKPASIPKRVVSSTSKSSAAAALPPPDITQPTSLFQTNLPGASDLLANVFDEHPSPITNVNIDTQAVLGSRSSSDSSPKIKTLRKQISEIIDNGKSVPVPSHQEHILFGDCLYICTHVFGTLAGTRTTEAYLWCGDGVPVASIEDAQLFAKKVARDNNAKLIVLKQGKETSSFFQALGGIVITRRGSGSRSGGSVGAAAPYLLCGRQHAGQIAFDELDFSPRSLCKGFPSIVSTRSGKIYIWKGSGSGADELGSARLIGMDLGLTGEIEEIDEGQEPDTFWQSFPEKKGDTHIAEGTRTGYWHLKPSCEKYTTRLYRIDVDALRPKSSSGFMQWGRRGSAPTDTKVATTAQIREIIPFAQSDLLDDGVFVLDAFFETFM